MEEKQKLDETQTQIVCIYLCQMLGCPTPKQIQKVMHEQMGLSENKTKIVNALNSAKKRGLLSVNHIQNAENSEVEDAYSMKDVRFANPPEIAHIKNVLPQLLANEGAKEIFDRMEGEHTEGERKGGRLPDIRDYVTWKVIFKNVLPVLGGQAFSSDDKENIAKNMHRRIGHKIWIPGNLWLKSAIGSRLRMHNIGDSKAMYIQINDCFLEPKQDTYQEILASPPQRAGGPGTGLVSFEALHPGETFEFEIAFPTTNGISEEVMRKILNGGLRIGARHKDFGLLAVENITVP